MPISRTELFIGFAKIGLMGFGGVAAIARHVIVEERRWLSEDDYAAVLGLGQVLPGANTVNASVIIGSRALGISGACMAVAGIMAPPLVVLIILATVYDSAIDQPLVRDGVAGAASAAAGVVIGTALKMARNLRPDWRGLLTGTAAVIGAGFAQVPLALLLAVLIPTGFALRLVRRR